MTNKKKPTNHGKPWTSNENKELKKLADGNTPTGIIAFKLGRTISAISNQASVNDISLNPTNKSPYDRKVSEAKKKKI